MSEEAHACVLDRGPASIGPAKKGPWARGAWSEDEDALLLNIVRSQASTNWVKVSEFVHTRSPKQCRERYLQNLNPELCHDPITPEEGKVIEDLMAQMGKRWTEIAQRLSGRSSNAVKNWVNSQNHRRRRLLRNDERVDANIGFASNAMDSGYSSWDPSCLSSDRSSSSWNPSYLNSNPSSSSSNPSYSNWNPSLQESNELSELQSHNPIPIPEFWGDESRIQKRQSQHQDGPSFGSLHDSLAWQGVWEEFGLTACDSTESEPHFSTHEIGSAAPKMYRYDVPYLKQPKSRSHLQNLAAANACDNLVIVPAHKDGICNGLINICKRKSRVFKPRKPGTLTDERIARAKAVRDCPGGACADCRRKKTKCTHFLTDWPIPEHRSDARTESDSSDSPPSPSPENETWYSRLGVDSSCGIADQHEHP